MKVISHCAKLGMYLIDITVAINRFIVFVFAVNDTNRLSADAVTLIDDHFIAF